MKKIIFFLIMLLVLLTGCSVTTNIDKTEKYEGEELRIGIVGNIPEIRESQVDF